MAEYYAVAFIANYYFRFSQQIMTFFRQYIIPLIVLTIFILALVAVSARIFLPSDMAAPAPVGLLTF